MSKRDPKNARTRRGETRTSSSRQLPDAVRTRTRTETTHTCTHTHARAQNPVVVRIRPLPPAASTHVARAAINRPDRSAARAQRVPAVARFPTSLRGRDYTRPARQPDIYPRPSSRPRACYSTDSRRSFGQRQHEKKNDNVSGN